MSMSADSLTATRLRRAGSDTSAPIAFTLFGGYCEPIVRFGDVFGRTFRDARLASRPLNTFLEGK